VKSTNLLWNHTLQSITYKWDDPATTAGTTYDAFKGDTHKGPTTKCLSCHDVHNGARTKEQLLLPGLMSGSNRALGGYICTQCHLK
jgi:hypothetical protein